MAFKLTYIINYTKAFCIILHQNGVVEIEMENVTTFVCLSHLLVVYCCFETLCNSNYLNFLLYNSKLNET